MLTGYLRHRARVADSSALVNVGTDHSCRHLPRRLGLHHPSPRGRPWIGLEAHVSALAK